MVLVKNAMTNPVYTISEKESFFDLVELMSQKGIGSVIITNSEGKPFQILTLRDVLKLVPLNLSQNKISDVIELLNKKDASLLAVYETDNLLKALQTMQQHAISHLPVFTENGNLAGILSFRDLLKHFPAIVFLDPLTGVNNRFYLDLLITKLERSKITLCVMMIDIDNFKQINDNYGHLFGDKVLKKLALILKENLKGHDEIVRYGGEEFVIFLYRCEGKDILKVGERLRKKIKSAKMFGDVSITVSIGATLYKPGESLLETIKKADTAMYMAKKEGKDRVVILL